MDSKEFTEGILKIIRRNDILESDLARVTEERDRLRTALHKIAYEPWGPDYASDRDVLELTTAFARKALEGGE